MEHLGDVILPIVGMIITAIIGWAAKCFSAWSGIQVEASHREALHSAIMTGVTLALAKFGITATPKQVAAEAMAYVTKSVPDALDHFGLDKKPEVLADMILSKAQTVQMTAVNSNVAKTGAVAS